MIEFLKKAFSDNDQPSSSRIVSASIAVSVTLAVIMWVSYLVFRYHSMPELTGPSVFLGTGVGTGATSYGINKLDSIVSAFKGGSK